MKNKPEWTARVPAVFGSLFTLAGVCYLLAFGFIHLSPRSLELLAYFDEYYLPVPRASLSWAVVLFLLAAALYRGKRMAVVVTVSMLVLMAVSNIVVAVSFGPDIAPLHWVIPGTAVQLALIGVLMYSRHEFVALIRRANFARAIGVFLLTMLVAIAAGWCIVRMFIPAVPANERLLFTLQYVLSFGAVDVIRSLGIGTFRVRMILGVISALPLVAAFITLLRSQRHTNMLAAEDEGLLRRQLASFGTADSLGYFATRRDKSVVFSPDGRAAVTYRVEVGHCLASADPIGDPQSWSSAIEEWLKTARVHGWNPCVLGASAHGAAAYHRAGLKVLRVGDEAVLQLGTRAALRNPEVRRHISACRKRGLTVRIRRHELIPVDQMQAIIADAEHWRVGGDERGFSMALSRLGDTADGQCLLAEVLDADGQRVAMHSYVPWGSTGISLDLMRRSPEAPPGVNEFLIGGLIDNADGLGLTRLSLNFAVFREIFADGAALGAGPVVRLARRVLLFASRFWQLESLYRSNDKYRPDWVPRYLAYTDASALGGALIAMGLAEGYLPRIRQRPPKNTPEAFAQAHLVADPDFTTVATRTVPEQTRIRTAKAEALRERGINPWPVAKPPTHTTMRALAAPAGSRVEVAGRVVRLRDFGGVVFVVIRDDAGTIQALITAQAGAAHTTARRDIDLGDLIQVAGTRCQSRSGEESIDVTQLRMNAKCLHPLPDKYHGLTDPEAQVRQRHVDLAINEASRQMVRDRSTILNALRAGLLEEGYLEVETPILQPIHGGANARPFRTHINAYDMDLYLRIAPELYLKRLAVGGVERVFEIGRTFRNEGVDFSHNPEFTILEAYRAHADYMDMLHTTRTLIQRAAEAVHGRCAVPGPEGQMVDISGQWPIVPFYDAVTANLGPAAHIGPLTPDTPVETLREVCQLLEIAWAGDWGHGELMLELYEHLVEERITTPQFTIDFPVSVSPLTGTHRHDPRLAERWDLVAWGVELGTAYSELTNPLDQRERLTAQSVRAAGGDPEAMELDEDFLTALEFGMPPTGGLGMGVDRVVMFVTGKSLRETLPFPLVRPRS